MEFSKLKRVKQMGSNSANDLIGRKPRNAESSPFLRNEYRGEAAILESEIYAQQVSAWALESQTDRAVSV